MLILWVVWCSRSPSLRAPELSLSTFKRLLKTQLFQHAWTIVRRRCDWTASLAPNKNIRTQLNSTRTPAKLSHCFYFVFHSTTKTTILMMMMMIIMSTLIVGIGFHPSSLRVINIQQFISKQQVAQLSQRDRAAGWVSNGQRWKTGTERQYLRTI